jgi:hypothetical protein
MILSLLKLLNSRETLSDVSIIYGLHVFDFLEKLLPLMMQARTRSLSE